MKLRKVIKDFFQCRKMSATTTHNYQQCLRDFLAITKNVDISDIELKDIVRYKRFLIQKKYSQSMSLGYLFTLRGFFKWISQNYDNNILDYKRISFDEFSYKVNHWTCFTQEEIKLLRKTIKKQKISSLNILRDQVIFETLYSTGLRREELRNVKIQDIEFIKSQIKVIGKGNKPALVYLTKKAKTIITQYLQLRQDDCPYLISTHNSFCTLKPRQVNRGFIGKRFFVWGKLAKLKNCHAHMLRKSFATEMWQQGADIYQISRLARHSSVLTTQQYIIAREEDDKRTHDMYLGDNQKFIFEEKKAGRIIIKAEVWCGEGINTTKAKQAMQSAVSKLLT